MEFTREIYWNVYFGQMVYLLALLALCFMFWGIWKRVRLWRLGHSEIRTDQMPKRIYGLFKEVFTHKKQLRDTYPGLMHLFIFYGFFVSLLATTLIAIQEWSGIHFLKGNFYLWYSLISDSFGILGIIGLSMALWRRLVIRPDRMNSVADDYIALGLLLLIFVQGFVVEGLRIALTELNQKPELAIWSPGGYVLALAFQHIDTQKLLFLHRFNWWFHAITAFIFIGYMGFGKFNHIWYGIMNITFRNLNPSGKLEFVDIEEAMENNPDDIENLGVEKIDQYSWKGLLDLDACTNCGRCQDVCPAYGSGVPLSPKKLIQDMKLHLSKTGDSKFSKKEEKNEGKLFGDEENSAVLEEELWGCRTCGACQEECPVFIEHIPKMVDMRRHLVMMESKTPEYTRQFLKSIEERMHPWVGAQHNREEWYEGMDIKILSKEVNAEYLYWVGCTGSMIDRNIQVTKAMVKILNAAGVDFGILGAEEVCTGDPARRAGGEFTFQICAKKNIETLNEYGVKKIITTCPHCFNTYKNEYPDFNGNYEVIHHTELINELIKNGQLNLKESLSSVTYHDPCYLGRHNNIYSQPRDVLKTITSKEGYIELEQSKSRSLCCGAGGGYAWMDDEPEKRINHTRLEQVKDCGAKTAAVSCPFCMQMFDDALKTVDPEKNIRAMDIAELVAESLEE
ncbi:MAG: iron-sulfur-binding reductase [Nitrospinae bacterium]|nr:iron-sulfur-binding reductase [Nitrospinota bacterium]